MTNTIKLAVISDIHLGHTRNSTSGIIKNLRRAIPDNAETSELDCIFLAGDVFDSLLTLPDEDVLDIDTWIVFLLRLCCKHNIILRVLEGTPSHDWKQSDRFTTLNQIMGIGANVRHVKDLSIEYLEALNKHVLYVPDEWETSTEKTLGQVQELLRAHGLAQVDLAIMHGQFDYQLPAHVKAPKHDSTAYLELVRDLIFIGHVHVFSQFQRIIAQGSFDRLSHGEEGPKGHVRASLHADGNYEVVFVENTHAMRFATIDCTGLDLEQTLAKVDREAQGLPEGSHARVQGDADNPIFANMELLVRQLPMLVWGKKINEEKEQTDAVVEDATVYAPITLTKDNLEGMLVNRLVQLEVDLLVLAAAKTMLQEVM